MRYLNNKYVYFILIFIAVFLFDLIIFQILFSQILTRYPDNITLGMILLISSFIVVPSVVAYYIAIQRQQGELAEQEKIEDRRRRKITIWIILAIILILVVKNLTAGKFNPYTFQTVTDQEFTKPLKILVEKKIGENEYYLKESEQGGVSLYQKVGENREDDRFIIDIKFVESESVADFWYDSPKGVIFIVEVREGLEQIFKYSLNIGMQYRIQVLKTSSLSMYSGVDRILDYFPETNSILMESGGGDGCGGGGTIWTLKGMQEQIIQKFGIGCWEFGEPRFAGYDGKFLYFAIFDQPQSGSYTEEGLLTEVFKVNPRTKDKIIVTNTELPDKIAQIKLAEDNRSILITTDKGQNFTLNLEQNSKLQEASSSAKN